MIDQNAPIYVPVHCISCSALYLVVRIRFGQEIEEKDFFICAKYLTVWNLIFKPSWKRREGKLLCPECRAPLATDQIWNQAVLGTTKASQEQWLKDTLVDQAKVMVESTIGVIKENAHEESNKESQKGSSKEV